MSIYSTSMDMISIGQIMKMTQESLIKNELNKCIYKYKLRRDVMRINYYDHSLLVFICFVCFVK